MTIKSACTLISKISSQRLQELHSPSLLNSRLSRVRLTVEGRRILNLSITLSMSNPTSLLRVWETVCMCVCVCARTSSHVPSVWVHDSPPVMVWGHRGRKMGLEVNLRSVQFIRFLKWCGSSRRRQVEPGELSTELQHQQLGLTGAIHSFWKTKQKRETFLTVGTHH